MADRDYIRQAQAALGDDDHLLAIRRLHTTAPQASPRTEASEAPARRAPAEHPEHQ